jgi:glycosidase
MQAIWANPSTARQRGRSYDGTDCQDIDPRFGTIDEFDRLLAAAHGRRRVGPPVRLYCR